MSSCFAARAARGLEAAGAAKLKPYRVDSVMIAFRRLLQIG
jgi:hypothetical protein